MSSIDPTHKGVNSYPKQPDAPIHLCVGVMTTTRSDERWRMSTTATEAFHLYSTLQISDTELRNYLDSIWAFAQAQRALDSTDKIEVHYMLQIENTTAAPPPTGAWLQKKMHYDGQLTDDEYDSTDTLMSVLQTTLAFIQKLAKY